MVGHGPLKAGILVRIQVPEHTLNKNPRKGDFCLILLLENTSEKINN